MMTELVVDAILRHLPARDVDSFRMCNSSFKELIDKNRLKYAATEVQELDFGVRNTCESEVKVFCPKFNDGFEVDFYEATANANDLPSLINPLSPERVILLDGRVAKMIDSRWLKKTKEMVMMRIIDEDFTLNLLDTLKLSRVIIKSPLLEMDVDKVLDTMPNVSILKIEIYENDFRFPSKCSSTTLRTLIAKSHLGEGLKKVWLSNKPETPFDPDQVISFLKEAKFQPGYATIVFANIAGNIEDLYDMMYELMNETGWSITCKSNEKFLIGTPVTVVEFCFNVSSY